MGLLHRKRLGGKIMPTKTLGVALYQENYEKIKEEATLLDRSMGWIINKAIEIYFLRKEELKEGKV